MFLHCYSTTVTSHLNTAITLIKVLTLLTIIIVGLVQLGILPPEFQPPFEDTTTSARGYVSAIIGGYWSFAGWQGIPSVIEDVKEPRKTMPRAIICGVMITIIVYVCVNFSFLCVLNVEEMKSSSLITYSFAFKLAGKYLSTPLSLLVFLSLFGSFL